MQADIDLAQRKLNAARALPESDPNRLPLINHWAAEIRRTRFEITKDRQANAKAKRYFRAIGQRKDQR